MFGFIRQRNRELEKSAPAAQSAAILVSKEDIYRENRGMEPILLLRKGYEVSQEELPRFIRNGARPNQFHVKQGLPLEPHQSIPIPSSRPQAQPSPARKGTSSSIGVPGLPLKTKNRHKVLILDADQKSMKRLIDCLFICGTSLDRIHPVRLAEHLPWAIDKHQPQILIVDYHLSGPYTGLEVLVALQQPVGIQQVILTISPRPTLTEDEHRLIQHFCRENNIKILRKPVDRHTLNRLLNE
jgi:hypothetical protein